VLSKIESTGCAIEDAIAEACAAGFAESDPSEDLDGVDAAAKLSILCALAFNLRVPPASIETRSTASIGATEFAKAKLRGGTIRQVAHAAFNREHGRLVAWVAPVFVKHGTLFSTIYGPSNAAIISCAYAGDIVLSGQGAGGDASAVAIIADVLAIARDRAAIVPAPKLVPARDIQGLSDSSIAEAV